MMIMTDGSTTLSVTILQRHRDPALEFLVVLILRRSSLFLRRCSSRVFEHYCTYVTQFWHCYPFLSHAPPFLLCLHLILRFLQINQHHLDSLVISSVPFHQKWTETNVTIPLGMIITNPIFIRSPFTHFFINFHCIHSHQFMLFS